MFQIFNFTAEHSYIHIYIYMQYIYVINSLIATIVCFSQLFMNLFVGFLFVEIKSANVN